MLYHLNNTRLKEPTAHAHLNLSVGPYSIDMFGSLIGASGLAQFTIKKSDTIPSSYCFRNQLSNVHAQQIKKNLH